MALGAALTVSDQDGSVHALLIGRSRRRFGPSSQSSSSTTSTGTSSTGSSTAAGRDYVKSRRYDGFNADQERKKP